MPGISPQSISGAGQGNYKPTMPTNRFYLMLGCAAMFDFVQIIIAVVFFSPHISLPLLSSGLSAQACMSLFELGETVCALVAAGAGVATITATGVLDTLTAGSLTMFSQSMGQLFSGIVGFTGVLFFGFWFLLSGVSFFKGTRALKRFGGLGVQTIVEIVPFLGTLPSLTASVAYICIQARREDRESLVAQTQKRQQQVGTAARAIAIRQAQEQALQEQYRIAQEDQLPRP